MRLFSAVLFDEATLDVISSYRDQLHDASYRGRFPKRDNLHLTLEFLGEIDNPSSAIRALSRLEFKPFDLVMDRIGFFQRPDGDTWWIGVEADNPVMVLQARLHRLFMEEGLSLEKRKYVPHITLGRNVVTDAPACRIAKLSFHVTSVSLMLSEREDGGMRYTSLYDRDL